MNMRQKTKYPGVYYREAKRVGGEGLEKVFYVVFKRDGKVVEEKVGRQFKDDMTPAKAATIRGRLAEGKIKTRREKKEDAAREAATKKWTIDALWQEYSASKHDIKGFKTDANRYALHIKPAIGDKVPPKLAPTDIERIKLAMKKKDYAPQTIKHVLALIKRIVNHGRYLGLTPGISFRVNMPQVHNTKTEDLDPDQLSRLLLAIEEDPNRAAAAIMKTALFTGMRRSEIFRLQWEDVNFHRGTISIRAPKGGKNQEIPLNDEARKLFEGLPRTEGSPYVFPGTEGGQRVTISVAANRIRKAAGLPEDFRPMHGLRHVYASMLASSGQVDMYVLQKLLTHKSPAMTQRYAHLRDDALKRAAGLAGEIIGNALDECGKDKMKSGKKNIANG